MLFKLTNIIKSSSWPGPKLHKLQIAYQLHQITVPITQNRPVPSLKQMADLAVALIVVAGVTVQQALHRLGQRRTADFEQKMKMIGHQDVGVQCERMALDHVAEQDLEAAMVLIVFVNALPLIAPADDVVERAGKM
jgi:hypothetical protein